jgi:zinc protease
MKAESLRNDDNTRLRAWNRLTRMVYPEGHPYRAETTDAMMRSVARTTTADLRDYYDKRWVGSDLILAVVGDVDPEATAALVDSLFGAIPRGVRPAPAVPVTAPDAPERVVERLPGKANIDFVYGEASGLRRLDPDYEASIVANAALGQSALTSRIGKRVRDTEGLSYSLYSRFFWSDWVDGVWLVDVAVAPQNLAKALRSTKEEIDRYCKDGITDEEVAVQKEFFAGNFLVNLGTNAGMAGSLVYGEKFGLGPAYLDDFPKRVRAVTKEQVNEAIRKRLDPSKMHLVIAGDVASIPE